MHDQDFHHGRELAADQADRTDAQWHGRINAAGRWLWFLVVRNRIAIAIASLIWLAWRSGTQPRRLAYPCQQAAAANLGFLAILFIPGLSKLRQRKLATVRTRAMAMATGSVCLAGVLFILISGGVAVYSEYADSSSDYTAITSLNTSTEGTGVPATVAMVKDPDGGSTTSDNIDYMVRKAVALAGGLPVYPGNTVVIKPNWVEGDSRYDATSGVVTNPRVVEIVVDMSFEAGASSVTIAEGSANNTFDAARYAGYDTDQNHYFDPYNSTVQIVDLNDQGGIDHTDYCSEVLLDGNEGRPSGVIRSSYACVPDILLDSDVLISVPIFKNHRNGTITLSLKNRVGCPPSDYYYHPSVVGMYKWGLVHTVDKFPQNMGPTVTGGENEIVQRTLVDLNLVRPQDFVVVDALRGMTNGPVIYGDVGSGQIDIIDPEMQMIMASSDTLALDTVGALCMGYSPDNIPQLDWADSTNYLGTRDRRLITVVGDRVAQVRNDFPLGWISDSYGSPSRAEAVSPYMTGVSLVEGQPVVAEESSTVTVIGAGDNVAVIKAELAMKRTDAENLLVNGDFESGSAGWGTYHSDWGNNAGQVDFSSTEPGHLGDSALHLYLNPGQDDSFAVYQEVPVTPGKKYKIDAYWKANYYGHDSWYETMLIDGPWDVDQADTGGPIVLNNHMYSYDTNDSANCVGGNPITASFDWVWTHTQNDEDVDNCWNDRDGVRIASGNTMTVVLKTGSCCGTNQSDVWFDEVSLVEINDEEIVVATVPDPGSTFDIVWDATSLPLGNYEARVSVYDAMMNEVTVTRNVELVIPDAPLIGIDVADIEHTIFVGESCPADSFSTVNAGIDTLNYNMSWDVSWLGVVPPFGMSTGYPANRHAIYYSCDDLSPGVNVATITISGNAYNTPQTITVTVNVETIVADFDTDGDVDQNDFGHLQECLTGPGVPQEDPTCQDADLNNDGDVDIDDFGRLQGCMSGPNVPPDPLCLPD